MTSSSSVIRIASAGLLSAIAKRLPVTDQWCILYPTIRPHLRSETVTLAETDLLNALLPPVNLSKLESCGGFGAKS